MKYLWTYAVKLVRTGVGDLDIIIEVPKQAMLEIFNFFSEGPSTRTFEIFHVCDADGGNRHFQLTPAGLTRDDFPHNQIIYPFSRDVLELHNHATPYPIRVVYGDELYLQYKGCANAEIAYFFIRGYINICSVPTITNAVGATVTEYQNYLRVVE